MNHPTTLQPPQLNETLRLTITDTVYPGKGLARHQGCVVFVPRTLPGETVEATITRAHPNFAEARLSTLLEPSPHRTPPACPLADSCPGCTYQHCSYAEELRIKQRQLLDFMQHRLHLPESLATQLTPAPNPLAYRNKISLHAGQRQPARTLGYYAADNRSILDVPACPLAVPPINQRILELRQEPAFLHSLPPRGSVTLRFTQLNGVTVLAGKQIDGRALLTETTTIGPIQTPAADFFQVHNAMADHLVLHVAQLIRNLTPELVIDLYCGAGVFALASAKLTATPRSIGFDTNARSINAARLNAANLNLPHASFHHGDAAVGLRKTSRNTTTPPHTTLIVDPPRQGLHDPMLAAILSAKPSAIIYVSCAPDTLTRDCLHLSKAGYSVQDLHLFDMFPKTPYFESVALLQLN